MNVQSRLECEYSLRIGNPAIGTSAVRAVACTIQMMLDAAALLVGFAVVVVWVPVPAIGPTAAPLLLIFLVIAFATRAYTPDALISFSAASARTITALLVALSLGFVLLFLLRTGEHLSRGQILSGALLGAVLLLVERLCSTVLVRRTIGSRLIRRLLIVDGTAVPAADRFEVIRSDEAGIRPDVQDPIMLHHFARLVAGADRVVVSCPPCDRENWATYLKGAGCSGELLVPELHGIGPLHHEAHLGPAGVIVSSGPLDLQSRVAKRLLDLAITVPALVMMAPLLLAIAVLIKLDSKGPVLFRQQRMGRGNRLFEVLKFRTMREEGADGLGHRSASRDDDRITRIGRVLRGCSLDELPQFLNVLLGDMSLVGPRPHALGSRAGDELFWHVDARYWLRHAIKPGITGLAQVRGYRGATVHRHDLSQRLHSDLEYVAHWSIFRDLAILCRTSLVMVHRNAF